MFRLLDAASFSIRNQGPPEGSREGKGARNKLLRANFQQCQGLERAGGWAGAVPMKHPHPDGAKESPELLML